MLPCLRCDRLLPVPLAFRAARLKETPNRNFMELSLARTAEPSQNLRKVGGHAGLPDQSRNAVVSTT